MTSRRLRCLILGAGWLLVLAYAFPGLMSPDSGAQLFQARGLDAIGDWHPPIMAELWRFVDRVVAGPFGMLVLQTGTFLFGVDALLRRALRPVSAAIAAVAILLLPPVLAPMAVIWKDSQMAGLLPLGAALLLAERRRHRVLGLGLLVIATAMRYNAAAATLPLILLLLDEHPRAWRRYAIAAAAWLAVTGVAFGVNRMFTERRDHAWHNSLALFDIVGTIRYSPGYADADIERDVAGTGLVVHDGIRALCHAAYTPTGHFGLTHGDRRIFDLPGDQHLDEITAGWTTVVTEHLRGYLDHRLAVFGGVLAIRGVADGPLWRSFADKDLAETLHVSTQHSALQDHWMDAIAKLVRTWLFRPRCYLLLTLLLLPLCRSRLGLAVLLSGLLYELGLFVVAPSTDFRYSHWMIVTTVIGIVLTFRSRLE